jgi:molybdopterin biosynthesis enzyme
MALAEPQNLCEHQCRRRGRKAASDERVGERARLTMGCVRRPGRAEFLPVVLRRRDDGVLRAHPTEAGGRSVLLAWACADGFVHVPTDESYLEV